MNPLRWLRNRRADHHALTAMTPQERAVCRAYSIPPRFIARAHTYDNATTMQADAAAWTLAVARYRLKDHPHDVDRLNLDFAKVEAQWSKVEAQWCSASSWGVHRLIDDGDEQVCELCGTALPARTNQTTNERRLEDNDITVTIDEEEPPYQ
jgi:hypothetical protein